MTLNIEKNILVISAHQKHISPETVKIETNRAANLFLFSGYTVHEGVGNWEGEEEGFLVVTGEKNNNGWSLKDLADMIAKANNQLAYVLNSALYHISDGQYTEFLSIKPVVVDGQNNHKHSVYIPKLDKTVLLTEDIEE